MMAAMRPFRSAAAMAVTADEVWASLGPADWLEAFAAHPRIGEQAREAPETGMGTRWSDVEQSGVAAASDAVRERLAMKNRAYEARFGYIFIVCASGKRAGELLEIVERRLTNDAAAELQIAGEEQRKITRLRLAKLLDA
jgi:OHCU decarboxylase